MESVYMLAHDQRSLVLCRKLQPEAVPFHGAWLPSIAEVSMGV
jgi:hypothetical protein